MKSIKEIFNKEMVRVFKDKKMVFSVFFLPVIIMIGIMYLMSQMITGMEDDITKHKPIVYVQNEQESFEKFLESICADYKIYTISESERADVETKIRDGEADLLIEFPKNMDEMIQNCTEDNYNQMVSNLKHVQYLINNGYFTKKLFVDTIMALD